MLSLYLLSTVVLFVRVRRKAARNNCEPYQCGKLSNRSATTRLHNKHSVSFIQWTSNSIVPQKAILVKHFCRDSAMVNSSHVPTSVMAITFRISGILAKLSSMCVDSWSCTFLRLLVIGVSPQWRRRKWSPFPQFKIDSCFKTENFHEPDLHSYVGPIR